MERCQAALFLHGFPQAARNPEHPRLRGQMEQLPAPPMQWQPLTGLSGTRCGMSPSQAGEGGNGHSCLCPCFLLRGFFHPESTDKLCLEKNDQNQKTKLERAHHAVTSSISALQSGVKFTPPAPQALPVCKTPPMEAGRDYPGL